MVANKYLVVPKELILPQRALFGAVYDLEFSVKVGSSSDSVQRTSDEACDQLSLGQSERDPRL